MQESGRSSRGLRKTFFENSRWLILHLVFLKLHTEYGENMSLTDDEKERITRVTIELAEFLWRACESLGFVSRRSDSAHGHDHYEQTRHFRSVFGSADDCRRLKDKTLALIATSNV